MSYPHRGSRKRRERKREDSIKFRLESHKISDKNLKRNIKVWHLGSPDIPQDFLIVEFNFFENHISAKELRDILVKRLGDLF